MLCQLSYASFRVEKPRLRRSGAALSGGENSCRTLKNIPQAYTRSQGATACGRSGISIGVEMPLMDFMLDC
jgi:hypothetical protein